MVGLSSEPGRQMADASIREATLRLPALRAVPGNTALGPAYSPPDRREAVPGPADTAFRDRAHRKRTRLSVEDARPSETP